MTSFGSDEIRAMFADEHGDYAFARWGRPIVPVVFGLEEVTLRVVKGAIEAIVALANHKMAEVDADLGANLMIFFFRDWDELASVPNLDQMIVGLDRLLLRLAAQDAHHYRQFRYDEAGAIRACFCFVRLDAHMAGMSADVLALNEAVRVILDWSGAAFANNGPIVMTGGVAVVRPEVAAVIRAAYDPVMPTVAKDPSHALRILARMGMQV